MQIKLWSPGGLPECPYFKRSVLDLGPFSIRLHYWLGDDDLRAYHDHPFWFLTLVLWGGYLDISPLKQDRLRVGSIRFRPASHKHMVKLTHRPTLTLLITGPANRKWGFYVGYPGLWKRFLRDKYFAEQGHHPCDPLSKPVRIRPDGSKIEEVS